MNEHDRILLLKIKGETEFLLTRFGLFYGVLPPTVQHPEFNGRIQAPLAYHFSIFPFHSDNEAELRMLTGYYKPLLFLGNGHQSQNITHTNHLNYEF